MKRITATVLAATGFVLTAQAAEARSASSPDDGVYVAASVSSSHLKDPRIVVANAPTPGQTLYSVNHVDSGWGGHAAVGYAYRFVRVELEYGRTTGADVKSHQGTSPSTIVVPASGKNEVIRYMANVYLELPSDRFPVRPFVGAGVGAARGHVTTVGVPVLALAAPARILVDNRETNSAYQVMAGVTVPVGDRFSLTLQYRWLDAGRVDGLDARREAISRELRGGNIDLGVRYRF